MTPCFFFGTSAAAPHAAGVTALLLQMAPYLLSSSPLNSAAIARANLRNSLKSTAVPLTGLLQSTPNNTEGFGLINALAAAATMLTTTDAGTNQLVNSTGPNGAAVNLAGSGSDPNHCALSFSWSGSCSTAVGNTPGVICPLGVDTEARSINNGGVETSLPTSPVQIIVSDFTTTTTQSSVTVQTGRSGTNTITVNSRFGAFTQSCIA